MTTLRRTIPSLAVFLLASAPLALAQGTYTQFDVPGAEYTEGFDMNSSGDIVGAYASGGSLLGFLLSGGTYTTITYPGAEFTSPYGINNKGQIVGTAEFSDGSKIGFIYIISTQTFTSINFPGAEDTYASGINDEGVITGHFDTCLDCMLYGFKLRRSTYRVIAPPASHDTFAVGVTDSGTVAGYYLNHDNNEVFFSFSNGKYRQIAHPLESYIEVSGVGPTELVLVGYYIPRNGNGFYGYVLDQSGTFTSLQFPGGQDNTSASGVNVAGVVVGTFKGADGAFHGFTWTPPADAAKK